MDVYLACDDRCAFPVMATFGSLAMARAYIVQRARHAGMKLTEPPCWAPGSTLLDSRGISTEYYVVSEEVLTGDAARYVVE
jgi:hypothetical protein